MTTIKRYGDKGVTLSQTPWTCKKKKGDPLISMEKDTFVLHQFIHWIHFSLNPILLKTNKRKSQFMRSSLMFNISKKLNTAHSLYHYPRHPNMPYTRLHKIELHCNARPGCPQSPHACGIWETTISIWEATCCNAKFDKIFISSIFPHISIHFGQERLNKKMWFKLQFFSVSSKSKTWITISMILFFKILIHAIGHNGKKIDKTIILPDEQQVLT